MVKSLFNFDMQKLAEQFPIKMMPLDFSSFADAGRKNLETATELTSLMQQSAKALAERQAEVMQDNIARLNKTLHALGNGGTVQDKLLSQADFAREAYESAFAHMRDVGEFVGEVQHQAIDMIHDRISETLGTVRQTIHSTTAAPTPQPAKKAANKK